MREDQLAFLVNVLQVIDGLVILLSEVLILLIYQQLVLQTLQFGTVSTEEEIEVDLLHLEEDRVPHLLDHLVQPHPEEHEI